jgi:predicted MFS family arabinose efflux permease
MNSWTRLIFLALGAFTIGTESYVVAGVLPTIASDLGVSLAIAGQLITAFALTFAFGSPLIAVATGRTERRRLLLISIAGFGVFNLLAAFAHSYALLFLARIGMGLSAGTFMPAASAYAVATTPAEHRGRALSIIYGGLTVALVIGAPLGVLFGDRFGWRMIFVGVATLVATTLLGLALSLKRLRPSAAVTLSERIAVARRSDVLATLAVTVLTLSGVYTIYSYLAAFLQQTSHLSGDAIALVFFLFGIGSTVGNFVSGATSDRIGPRRVVAWVQTGLIGIFALLSVVALTVTPDVARWLIVPLIMVWGFVGFSFPSAQQAHIVKLAPKLATITLSLNSSAIYAGASLGALIGSVVIAHGTVRELGWVAAAGEIVALTLLRFTRRRREAAAPEEPTIPFGVPAAGESLSLGESA